MYHDLPRTARFWSFLLAIDQDLAERTRKQGMSLRRTLALPPITSASRVAPRQLPAPQCLRFSFCCDRDGCRKRVTPPSVRFLGPKVYLGVIVILISAMRQGPTPRRVRELSQRFGADRRTIARWQVFWREHFPQTPFWKTARARLVPLVEIVALPLLAAGCLPHPLSPLPGAGRCSCGFSLRSRSPEACQSRSRAGRFRPAEDARRSRLISRFIEVITVPSPHL